MKTSTARKFAGSVLLAWSVSFSAAAEAAIDSHGILDNVLDRYSAAANSWAAIITTHATWLFWTLALMSMVMTFGMMALRKSDIAEFYTEFVKFTLFTGFYWWILVNGSAFADSIMKSLRMIGLEAGGAPNALAPSGIVDIGMGIFYKALGQSDLWAPIDSMIGMIIALIILVVFCLISVNMLVLLISGWVLAYAGIFFLGFGGARWTSEMAIGYYKAVLNIAGQLFVMVLLVGIGKSFVDQYYAAMAQGLKITDLAAMLVVAIVLLRLITTVPGLVGGLAGGNTASLGHGFGTGAAVAAAAMAAAAVATAGAAVAAGAASAGGGMQALMAAFSKASASEAAGGGAASMGAEAAGGAGSGGGTLASAMGDEGGSGSTVGSGSPPSHLASEDSWGDSNSSGATAISAGASAAAAADASSSSGRDEKDGIHASVGSTSSDAESKGLSAEGRKKAGKLGTAGAVAAKTARVAAGTLANLAVGSWDVAKGNVSNLRDSAKERMANTTGGRIAAAIQARSAVDKAKFGDDSLSAAADDNAVDAAEEIAAFRDRGSI